jgi:hypothetical protein
VLAIGSQYEEPSETEEKAVLLNRFRQLLHKYCAIATQLQCASQLPATEARIDFRYSIKGSEVNAIYRADPSHVNGEPPELEWRIWPTTSTSQLCDDNEDLTSKLAYAKENLPPSSLWAITPSQSLS